jgi:hypothetical protein
LEGIGVVEHVDRVGPTLEEVVAEGGVESVDGDAEEGDGFDTSEVEGGAFEVAFGENDEAAGFFLAVGFDGQRGGEWLKTLLVGIVVLVEGGVFGEEVRVPAGDVEDAVKTVFVEVVGGFPLLDFIPLVQLLIGDVLDEITVEGADLLEDVALGIGTQTVGLGLFWSETDRGEAMVKIGLTTVCYTGFSHVNG